MENVYACDDCRDNSLGRCVRHQYMPFTYTPPYGHAHSQQVIFWLPFVVKAP